MASIIDFLEARIAEDEAAARRTAEVFPGEWDVEDRGYHAHVVCDGPHFHYVSELDQHQAPDTDLGGALETIARFAPARVLAECAAKRAIMAHHTTHTYTDEEPGFSMELWDCMCNRQTMKPCPTVAALAAVYKDHPDYQQEWA